jgi:endonuclease I
MSTAVLQAEESVKKLSHKEFSEFQRWFAEYQAALTWDEELERDAANGKIARMAASARVEYNAGYSTLHGTVLRYDDPTEPLPPDDWEASQ